MYGSRTVEAYVHRPEWELYDLEADPKELNNLAGKPDHSKSLADLKGKLRAWQESTRDPWLVKYEHE
jgi:N-sulfoglucosamine sulfohydrolase